MATVPAPRTWTVGELLTAAKLNTDLRDGLNVLLSPPMAVLRKSVAQAVANATLVFITWDVEDLDRDGGHSNVTNNTRYTSQTAGWYYLNGVVRWSTGAGDSREYLYRKTLSGGGTETYSMQSEPNVGALVRGSMHLFLSVNDYVEVGVAQNSGASINTSGHTDGNTRFEVRWASTT